MVDRRRDWRVSSPAEVFGTVKASIPARILDLSAHGMQIEVAISLRPGAEHNVALPEGDHDLKLRARVMWCRAEPPSPGSSENAKISYRAGLSFLYLTEEDIYGLEDVIVDLSLSESDDIHLSEETEEEPQPIRIKIPKVKSRRRRPSQEENA